MNTPSSQTSKRLALTVSLIAAAAIVAGIAWSRLKPNGLPEGIASGNGRLEATDIDIAAKTAGRIKTILVKEGEDVVEGQVLATLDTTTLDAEVQRAQAQVRQAAQAHETSEALLDQREQAVRTAEAVVAQRQAELALATKQFERTQELVAKGFLAPQKADEAQAQLQSAKAALSAARSQVAEARTAIVTTKSQINETEAAVGAAQAGLNRTHADRDDTVLRAPRGGRIQVLAAQAGEIVGAGGRVMSMVDVSDVHMTFFLPETAVGRVAIGSEARLVLDAAPQYVIPARVSYVASVAQFTPKTVETTAERQKLVFKVRAQIDPALLNQHRQQVKTGMPGMAYVQVQPDTVWPDKLAIKLPTPPSASASAAKAP